MPEHDNFHNDVDIESREGLRLGAYVTGLCGAFCEVAALHDVLQSNQSDKVLAVIFATVGGFCIATACGVYAESHQAPTAAELWPTEDSE